MAARIYFSLMLTAAWYCYNLLIKKTGQVNYMMISSKPVSLNPIDMNFIAVPARGGRILGDESFSEKALALAEEKWKNRWTLNQILDAVCLSYGLDQELLLEPGKKQPYAEARGIAAYLVQEEEYLSLTDLGNILNRDPSALSRAAGRIHERKRSNSNLSSKVASTRGWKNRVRVDFFRFFFTITRMANLFTINLFISSFIVLTL